MKERPILFSAPMIRAIIAGTKTQTRRVVKPLPDLSGLKTYQPTSGQTWGEHDAVAKLHDDGWHFEIPGTAIGSWRCPYGQPGDRLWVRETWQCVEQRKNGQRHCMSVPLPGTCTKPPVEPTVGRWVEYAATPSDEEPPRWRPSIHMPRWASRIDLEVTAVRVERLQDISEADAIAEGVERDLTGWTVYGSGGCEITTSARRSYASLWEAIHGPDSWAANPWAWVVEFRKL